MFYVKNKIPIETYNINLSESRLARLIEAYDLSKPSVFINGKKYDLENLQEIKIYTLDYMDSFNDLLIVRKLNGLNRYMSASKDFGKMRHECYG